MFAAPKSLKTYLTFLTRDDCPKASDMANNLDEALKALGWPRHDYRYIDIRRLPITDVRARYPTPTLLWEGKDIFGMPAPNPTYSPS